ncbi:hypothetical protein L6452_30736 [Arctium lappa]|uniref:Uncharacterized protein n=1 Tax=Arctium lappa TaxID=4217 RepID=A0ACB8ZIT3_ARCLA|nr:hypothetical protein L6452_30736 [Arctium lappa]
MCLTGVTMCEYVLKRILRNDVLYSDVSDISSSEFDCNTNNAGHAAKGVEHSTNVIEVGSASTGATNTEHADKGALPPRNVIAVGTSGTRHAAKGVEHSTNVIEVGSASTGATNTEHADKGALPPRNVITVGTSGTYSDFVVSSRSVRATSSKCQEVGEKVRTHLTNKIVQDVRSISLNDALKSNIHSMRSGLRSSERNVNKCVQNDDETFGQKLDKPDTKDIKSGGRQIDKCVGKKDERVAHRVVKPETKALLYVESTDFENMREEDLNKAKLGWSFDSLKKMETSELNSGGLGSGTLKRLSMQTPMAIDTSDRQHGHATLDPLSSESPMEIDTYTAARDERESERNEDTDRTRLDVIHLMDDQIALIVTTKWETETLLESLLAKYPNDESFANYIYILQDIYKYDISYGSSINGDFSMHGDQSNVSEGEGTSHALVLSQKPEKELSQFWFTLTLHKFLQ